MSDKLFQRRSALGIVRLLLIFRHELSLLCSTTSAAVSCGDVRARRRRAFEHTACAQQRRFQPRIVEADPQKPQLSDITRCTLVFMPPPFLPLELACFGRVRCVVFC